jgi:AcrR family transcriptional regulator
MWLSWAWSVEKIASGLGVSVQTLYTHYGDELRNRDSARDIIKSWLIGKLEEAAARGSLTAMRQLDQIMKREDRQRRRLIELNYKRGEVIK